jgi:hypothetical protein
MAVKRGGRGEEGRGSKEDNVLKEKRRECNAGRMQGERIGEVLSCKLAKKGISSVRQQITGSGSSEFGCCRGPGS